MIKSGPPDEGVSASGRDQPLFRAEVISEQQTRFLGTVLLAPKISHSLFALFAALAATALLGLLFFGEYTRKERISGWLVPERGLIRIFAPEAAVVTELKVKDGDMVARGLPLLTLSTERQSSALGATQEEIVRRLTSRRDSMLAEREMRAQLDRDEVTSLTQRLAAIGDEQGHRRQEIQLQRERVQLAKEAVERSGRLREQGLLPAQLWQEAEDSRLDQSLRLAELEREQAEVERERQEVAAELKALPLRSRTALAAIERDVAALEQDLAEAEARRQIVLAAPQAGRITTVQTEPGGNADPAVPLLSIVPQGSALVAQLFIPTNAIGFIQPGQPVMLRYRPFPFQKFGHYHGVVADVAGSAVNPAELGQQFAGLTTLLRGDEPVYPVTVHLESQTVTAYGKAMALQPGMQLEADVQIETRRLVEWMLDPLFTLTGSLRG